MPGRDVVYLLGPKGPLDYWELRISLRSVEKFFSTPPRLWVVGYKPRWLNTDTVRFIPNKATFSSKECNIISNLVRAANEFDLTDEFVAMSDDHFFLQPTTWNDLRPYHLGAHKRNPRDYRPGYWTNVWRTGEMLRLANKPDFVCDAHVPYPISKAHVRRLRSFIKPRCTEYTVFSSYFGWTGYQADRLEQLPPGLRADLRHCKNVEQIEAKLPGARFGLFGANSGPLEWMRDYFLQMFPEPSRYESAKTTKTIIDEPAAYCC